MQEPLQERDERFMIIAICAGEERLFGELIRPYKRTAYGMALSVLGNEADAEDATQEACINAYLKLKNFRMESGFSTWLISIVLNQARGLLRKKHRKLTESIDVSTQCGKIISREIPDHRNVPCNRLLQQELHAFIHDAISGLPTTYREVFRLRDMDGHSICESAQILGVSETVIKVRLHRARRLLQRQLKMVYQSHGTGVKMRSPPRLPVSSITADIFVEVSLTADGVYRAINGRNRETDLSI